MRRIPIVQGEHAVVKDPHVMITTLLGSCVAVCLHDAKAKLGGMNHFLLGEPGADHVPRHGDMSRYGVHAMELLINEMMAKGASRNNLRAHIYGGATMISGLGSIGANNAAFAKRFMETEGIAIGHCDLGGNRARRVEFLPHEGRSRCTQVLDPDPVPAAIPARPTRQPAAPVGELELF